ncbi:unnamed protein product [Gadus morhua 'NCC']
MCCRERRGTPGSAMASTIRTRDNAALTTHQREQDEHLHHDLDNEYGTQGLAAMTPPPDSVPDPGLVSPNVSWDSLVSPNVSWASLVSPNVSRASLVSPNVSRASLVSPNVSWASLVSPNVSWASLVSPNVQKKV